MGKKILVIDDEELIIRSLTKLLETEGFETTIAKKGQDAIVMVEEEHFDLVIADIRMPGLNGVETVKEIVSICKDAGEESPPVIFITGYADEKVENEAKRLKPVAYILKPFDIVELLAQVKNILG